MSAAGEKNHSFEYDDENENIYWTPTTWNGVEKMPLYPSSSTGCSIYRTYSRRYIVVKYLFYRINYKYNALF